MLVRESHLRRIIRETVISEWYRNVGEGDDDDPHADDDIVLWDGLPKNVKIIYSTRDPSEEAIVGLCDTEQCAQFVSNMLNKWQGSSWFAHSSAKRSVFNNNVRAYGKKLAELFSELNAKGGADASDNEKVKSVVRPMIPSSPPWTDLKLGDVVGLWYDASSWASTAFFEAATGKTRSSGYTDKGGSGPYFLRADNGKPWNPSMLGKDIKFKPGKTMRGGKSFGMNTHLGFVGGIRNGEPIIFHNIHHLVYATPLSALSPSESMVVWTK